MRAFEFFISIDNFEYPEAMKKIIEYLESRGKLNADYNTLEDLYHEYSDSVGCSWRIVDDESLSEFAKFLTRVELRNGRYIVLNDWDD